MRLPDMSWLRKAGVIGMNRRNTDYIMRWNPRSLYPLVDDKSLTKQLAHKYGIPAAELYHVLHHHGDAARSEPILREHRQFAVKPARGSGGSGIVLIRDVTDFGFVKQNGDVVSWETMFYHISSILSGIYSLEGLEDKVLIERLIHADPVLQSVTYDGVPDIRVIVYRGVPAMAMVRLPTKASDGKANLHQGAIGAGIDMGSGVLTSAVHRNELVSLHPDTGQPIAGIAVPHWESMLMIAALSFEMTGMGYIGADLVLDRERGPLLLELNARPGIQIQMANRSGLLSRLERIDQAPDDIFGNPESRAKWAMHAFSVPVAA